MLVRSKAVLAFCLLVALLPSGNFLNPKDDIYIDDDTLEGSGGGNDEVKDDLESSGSGMGDDDEDTTEGSGGRPPIVGTPQIPQVPSKPVEENIATVTKVKPVDTPPQSPVEVTGVGNEPPESPEEDKEVRTEIDVHKDPTVVMNPKQEDRATSFFAQPGILAAVIGGAVVGLLCAILVVMFIVYRMRKKDEGSYALDEPKRSPTVNSYTKNSNREFYA
ncbi:syndecan [Schistocerca gregaria]|uniref:syndecan n=2 Tax=Schistocerca TaxID=7008 RepID=UPI00211F1E9A|nr:syndecan [Schistocerca gregaria]